MATAKLREEQEQIIDRGLVCSICTEILRNPRSLECGHDFCSECLEADVKARSRGGKYSCPNCRHPITVPRGGAKQFYSNNLVKNLVESLEQHSDGEKCSLCFDGLASSVCLTCDNVMMCISCKREHVDGEDVGHNIVRIEELGKIFECRLLEKLSTITSKSCLDVDKKQSANFKYKVTQLKKEVKELVKMGSTSVVLAAAKKLEDSINSVEVDLDRTIDTTGKSQADHRAYVETDFDKTLISKAVYMSFSEFQNAIGDSFLAVVFIVTGLMLQYINPFCFPYSSVAYFSCQRHSEIVEESYLIVSSYLCVCIGAFLLVHRIAKAYDYFLPLLIVGQMYPFTSVFGWKEEQNLKLCCFTCGGHHCAILTSLSRHHSGPYCNTCQTKHTMKHGDMWLTTDMLGLRLTFLACIDQNIYNVNEHVACESRARFHDIRPFQHNLPPRSHCPPASPVRKPAFSKRTRKNKKK